MPFHLVSSGSNAHGQLANGTIDDAHRFLPCMFDDRNSSSYDISEKIIHIATGGNHTLLLSEFTEDISGRTRRSLWGCGNGAFGQLGNCGRNKDETVFKRIDLQLAKNGLEDYQPRLICCSWETSYVVLSTEGRPDVLISMGSNHFGELGIGQSTSVRDKIFHTVYFDHLHLNGLALDEAYLRIKSISAGQRHVIVQMQIQLSDGSRRTLIVGWGAARHGQLDDRSTHKKNIPFFSLPKLIELPAHLNDPVAQIELGQQHSVFLHESGCLTGLGSNKKSQLASLDEFRDASCVGCTWNGTYWVNTTGTVYATGSHSKGQLGRALSLELLPAIQPHPVEFPFTTAPSEHVLRIACGSEHVLTLRTCLDHIPEVWGWGWNEHGNLGLCSTTDACMPLKLWPQKMDDARAIAIGVWAGCGTSWIALEKQ